MPTPSDSPERVVITATEIAEAGAIPAPRRALVPWWTVLIASLLTLCLPLLCVFAIGVRLAIRTRGAQLRAAWNRLLCTLLIISGLASAIVWSYLWFLRFPTPVTLPATAIATSDHLDSLDRLAAFPLAPSSRPMTGVEIAEWSKPLVVVVTRYSKFAGPGYLDTAGIGAGMLLMADEHGYLFGTNRHVVEQSGVLDFNRKRDRVLIFTKDDDSAPAEVAGRHRTLDLALLWMPRKNGSARFRQPIAPFRSVLLGTGIFVIGHPQRLFFTLSNGLGLATQRDRPVAALRSHQPRQQWRPGLRYARQSTGCGDVQDGPAE